jgi:hypothetical protein
MVTGTVCSAPGVVMLRKLMNNKISNELSALSVEIIHLVF